MSHSSSGSHNTRYVLIVFDLYFGVFATTTCVGTHFSPHALCAMAGTWRTTCNIDDDNDADDNDGCLD